MSDGLHRTDPVHELVQRLQALFSVPALDGVLLEPSTVLDHRELETAGPGVDDEDPHAQPSGAVRLGSSVSRFGPGRDSHCQFRTSGRSSPWDRTWIRCSISLFFKVSRAAPEVAWSRGTRSMTSIARLNRSSWFITVMSKGVVVVPS